MLKKYTFYLLLSIILVFGLIVIRVSEIGEYQPLYTQNSGEITGDAFVGQTFVASRNHLSSIGILIATYSGRDNTKPVIFHLRESADAPGDVHTVTVDPKNFGDNQFYDFAFSAISKSTNQTYFFSITSPESVHGDAIAVQLSAKDPYPAGVAYVRGSGRQHMDVAFRVSYNVPFGLYAMHTARAFLSTPISPLWYWAAVPTLAMMLFAWWVIRANSFKHLKLILFGLAVAAFIIRFIYARSLPFTFDEGNYLYDAWALLHGRFAGGDGYVKAPIVIAWIALWEAILGHTAIAGRIATITAGSALVYPIYLLTKTLWNQKAGLLSAALWALMGSAVVSTIYVHTQGIAIFFGVFGLALLVYALVLPFTKGESVGVWKFILAGAVLGLAVASRKSMLGLGPSVLLLLFAFSQTWRLRVQHTMYVGSGFFAVLAIFFTFAYSVYGTEGIIEAIGINSASDGISSIEDSQIEQVRAYSLRGMTPFFRESLPLILLSLVGLGFSGFSTPGVGKWSRMAFWLVSLTVYYWAWSFFSEYEGEGFMKYGIPLLWPLFGIVILSAALTPSVSPLYKGENSRGRALTQGLIGPIWIGSLAFFYMNWIKFHANYIAEFIPPLTILGGVGILAFIQSATHIQNKAIKISIVAVFIIVAAWAATVSNYITYVHEHTGTFTQTAAKQAAQWAQANIPYDQELFTGAALIPYLSGHHTSLDIAHPRWYAYEFTRTNPQRLATFLPATQDMLTAFHNANWLLLESQTGFSFLMEYSAIEKSIEADWERIHGIENGSNTLTFYKRIK